MTDGSADGFIGSSKCKNRMHGSDGLWEPLLYSTSSKAICDEDDKDLLDRLRRVTRMHANWVWQFDDRGHVTFEPVRLSGFTSRLFAGVPRVLLMSASLSEFTLKLLLPPDLAYEYRAWPPVFPQDHAPVYHIPTVKLNWKSTDEDYKKVIDATDDIIDARLRPERDRTHSQLRSHQTSVAAFASYSDDSSGTKTQRDYMKCSRTFPGSCRTR